MNVNNEMYRMFKEMKEGYKNKNKSQMEHGARCWLDLNPENPFDENTPEGEAFFQMKRCYTIWKRGDVDRKINHRRLLSWAEALCKLNPRQPYKFDKEADKIDQETKKLEELKREKQQQEEEAKAIQKRAQEIVQEEERVKKELAEKEKEKAQQELEQQRKQEEMKKALEQAIEEERKRIQAIEPKEEPVKETVVQEIPVELLFASGEPVEEEQPEEFSGEVKESKKKNVFARFIGKVKQYAHKSTE